MELTGAALASLVTRATEAVEGVRLRSRRRVSVAVDPRGVRVEVGVQAAGGVQLAGLGAAVQHSVARAVIATTGLPAQVDVTFEEIA